MTLKVVWSAGHGFNTAGKRTPDGEREWSFNDKVVRAAMDRLAQYNGVNQLRVDDPTGNTDVPLSTRSKKSNDWGADIYIAIHHNAYTGKWGGHTGTETYTYDGEWGGKKANDPKELALAKAVNEAIVAALGLQNRGLKRANFHEVREPKATAILTELGYMDSTIDIKVMRQDAKLKQAGINIANAVARLYGLVLKVASAPKPSVESAKAYKVVKQLNGYVSSTDAKAKKNAKAKVNAGTYSIYKEANGMINVTTKAGVPGSWINPADNKAAAAPAPAPKPAKSIDQLAREVINGVYGNGDKRKNALGSQYAAVQKRVDEILAPKPKLKSVDQVAREVIAGLYGNGDARRKRLEAEGYNYNTIQNRVNQLL